MKQKVLLGVAAAVLSVVFVFIGKVDRPSQSSDEKITKGSVNSTSAYISTPIEVSVTTDERKQSFSHAASTNTVEERVIELSELGMKNDAESFHKILETLDDPEPEIREAAVEAVLQFGDRRAVPALNALAAQTQDAEERARVLEAVEFLNLPSLSEVRAGRGRNLNSQSGK